MKLNFFKNILLIVLFLGIGNTLAQNSFTLQMAIETALKNNYAILVEKNNATIADINNSIGNAGMLPEIGVKGSLGYSMSNETQKLASGTATTYEGLSSTAMNAGVELSWTLFDGGRMFVEVKKLSQMEEQSLLKYNQQVLQTIYSVVSAYYNISRQKQQLKSLNEVMLLNKERLKIAQAGFHAGTMVKTDLLQANIDFNVTQESIVNQENIIKQAQGNLAVLLNLKPDTMLMVDDSIPLGYEPDRTALFSQLDSLNNEILIYKKQLKIAELNVKQSKMAYLPIISLRAGYYLGLLNNSDGNLLQNNSSGPEVLASVYIPLYTAGENMRKHSGAKLLKASAEYEMENAMLMQKYALQTALNDFDNYRQLLILEEENYKLSRENFEISIERLKQGRTNSLEVHAAQESFMQSSTRMLNFRYGLKLSEIRLKQLVAQY